MKYTLTELKLIRDGLVALERFSNLSDKIDIEETLDKTHRLMAARAINLIATGQKEIESYTTYLADTGLSHLMRYLKTGDKDSLHCAMYFLERLYDIETDDSF